MEAGGSNIGSESDEPDGNRINRQPSLDRKSSLVRSIRSILASDMVSFATFRVESERSTMSGVGADFIHLIHDDASSRSMPVLSSGSYTFDENDIFEKPMGLMGYVLASLHTLILSLSIDFCRAKAVASSIQFVADDGVVT